VNAQAAFSKLRRYGIADDPVDLEIVLDDEPMAYSVIIPIIRGKVVDEQLAGPTMAAWASMNLPVVVAAHFFGALAGGALAIIISLAECLPGSRLSGFCHCRELKNDGAKRTALPKRIFSGSSQETCRSFF
jgi:hypothetical protein